MIMPPETFTDDDMRIAREAAEIMDPGSWILWSQQRKEIDARNVARCRIEEPRINCGGHYLDYCFISDDDDGMESYYGADYFATNGAAPPRTVE